MGREFRRKEVNANRNCEGGGGRRMGERNDDGADNKDMRD
jgi:hypothetical protein